MCSCDGDRKENCVNPRWLVTAKSPLEITSIPIRMCTSPLRMPFVTVTPVTVT